VDIANAAGDKIANESIKPYDLPYPIPIEKSIQTFK